MRYFSHYELPAKPRVFSRARFSEMLIWDTFSRIIYVFIFGPQGTPSALNIFNNIKLTSLNSAQAVYATV